MASETYHVIHRLDFYGQHHWCSFCMFVPQCASHASRGEKQTCNVEEFYRRMLLCRAPILWTIAAGRVVHEPSVANSSSYSKTLGGLATHAHPRVSCRILAYGGDGMKILTECEGTDAIVVYNIKLKECYILIYVINIINLGAWKCIPQHAMSPAPVFRITSHLALWLPQTTLPTGKLSWWCCESLITQRLTEFRFPAEGLSYNILSLVKRVVVQTLEVYMMTSSLLFSHRKRKMELVAIMGFLQHIVWS